jgi:Zn-dependent protease
MEQRPPQYPPPYPPPAPPKVESAPPPLRYEPPKKPWLSKLKTIGGPLVLILVLLAKWFGKIKFLIIPILKFFPVLLKTGGSMILMIGVYAAMFGWKWAVGFVLLLFIHELGHVIAAKRLGLPVSAPVFVPFLGAFILMKETPKNAWIEAQVGIGGPLFGTLGAVICYAVYVFSGEPLWAALAYSGFFLNLFNLAPIGFLDGGRIVTALSPWLWVVGTIIIVVMIVLSFNPILVLLLVISIPRLFTLFRKRTDEEKRFYEVSPGQRVLMGFLYFGLAGALAYGMKLIHDAQPGLR